MGSALTRLLRRGKANNENSETPGVTEQVETDESEARPAEKDGDRPQSRLPGAKVQVTAEERGPRSRSAPGWAGR